MFQAGVSFTHLVATQKTDKHLLVTDGIYTHLRHPSYTGWFYWSVGCQLLLLNPLCLVAWAGASWHFFRGRIHEEELYLLRFFGDDYRRYHQRSWVCIPFIDSKLPPTKTN
jgi:protein-S-isoprenylcysteine O-methyltransferase